MMNSVLIILISLALVKCKVLVQERATGMVGCNGREGWWSCGKGDDCISRSQMCDGKPDCDEGGDEDPTTCASWKCVHGVRCQQSNICIDIPHQVICAGDGAQTVCPDKSDQSYCLHRIYTGCFINTSLGLTITDCDTCFCQLRDKADTKQSTAAVFRSIGRSFRSSHIMARVCAQRSSSEICDGVEDCMLGEDEDPEMCRNRENDPDGFLRENYESQRKGRKVELDQFDIGNVADLESEDVVEISIDIKMICTIFIATLVSVVGFCLAIIFVMFRLSTKNHRKHVHAESIPIEGQTSSGLPNTYILQPRPQKEKKESTWTLQNTSIIKELGKGFYSKVYLAQDKRYGYVAIKTVDTKKTNKSEECIINEIDILSNIKPHPNIIRLIGSNMEEKLLVIDFCFHGNLKDYVVQYKRYFVDEINPETQEPNNDTYLCASPVLSEHIPMSDYIMNIHAKMDTLDGEEKDEKNSKSSLRTKRLLYWSYQASLGLKHLADQGIIHRDVALRNILLTSKDIIKIADFGLAVSSSSTSQGGQFGETPQYWSRSNKPTPYKWLAMESLASGVFSTQSDVWAFGILLWELFSLGEEPYGDVNPVELTKMLQAGGRLDKRKFATHKVNQLIKNCWHKDPLQRPTVEDVTNTLSLYRTQDDLNRYDSRNRLDSGVSSCEGYLDMNCTTASTSSGSREASQYLTLPRLDEGNYKHSSPRAQRTSYWTNYKIINGAPVHVEQVEGENLAIRAASA